MFVPHSEKPPHHFIGKRFKLGKSFRNMNGTFLKDSVLTCENVTGKEGDPRAVILIDEKNNQLLLNAFDFIKYCIQEV